MSQVAINWCISKGTIPIPGAKSLKQAKENIGALGWFLSDGEVIELDHVADRVEKKMVQNIFQTKWDKSKYLKNKVKGAVKFITSFEKQLVFQAKKRGCTGVICGHIHTVADTHINGIHYLNCGDWIENNSYIVYDKGLFEHRYSL